MRLIDTGYKDAYTNMAIDEAIMTLVSKAKVPATLRFFAWKPAAISIGYFQSLDKEVDLEKCKELGVDYVRRITGGGAVFHDAEITYSFHIPEKDVPKDIMQSYDLICGALSSSACSTTPVILHSLKQRLCPWEWVLSCISMRKELMPGKNSSG